MNSFPESPPESPPENPKINTDIHKPYRPILPHIPSLVQVTKPAASASRLSHHGVSIDGLLQEYMDSQQPSNEQEAEELQMPHDATPIPPKEKINGVPQDNSKIDLKQDIALLKKILHSKQLMKVGSKAFKGINEASATSHGSFDKADAAKNVNAELQLHLSQDEVKHLARSPDAIKVISEFMEHEKQKKLGRNMTASGSENTTAPTASPLPTTVPPSQAPSNPPSPSPLPIKDFDPTAKLGGKIMGNLLYEKILKPSQDQAEKQNKPTGTVKNTQMSVLKKKITALQAISDALKLITNKIEIEDSGGKKQQGGKFITPHFDVGSLEVSENVNQKDINFLQDKINRAIETTEEMSRQEALRHPEEVALNTQGKVQDMTGTTRDNVLKRNEKLRVDKEIKDIEDSFNDFIEKVEQRGKLKGLNISTKPTESLYQQIQNGAFKMVFDDAKEKKAKSNAKGVYGFEVESQEPVINIIPDKDTTAESKTSEKPTSRSTQTNPNEKVPTVNQIQTVNSNAQNLTKIPKKTVSKAVSSITTAIRRQGTNKISSIALLPITTFNNIQDDVTLGGRINSEVIKEKKEKSYHGKDIKKLLTVLKVKPTTKAPSLSIEVVNNADNDKPKQPSQSPSMAIKVLNGTKPKDDKEPVAEVKTVGKLDESTVKLLSIVVQGYLDKSRRRHHRRRKKKKHHKYPTEAEQEGFMVGAKHDVVSSRASKKKLDGELLDMLEEQLSHSQKPGIYPANLVNDGVDEDFSDNDGVKALPNDREIEQEEPDISPELLEGRKSPAQAPSDDPSIQVNRYTSDSSIDNLVHALKQMIEDNKSEVSKTTGYSPGKPTKSITASRAKPHVIQFKGATTSGKIGLLTADQGIPSDQKVSQMFTGGKISEGLVKPVLKPVSLEALAAINIAPTTKSSVGTASGSTSSGKKLKNLVSGVKRLLKALRGSVTDDERDETDNDSISNDNQYGEGRKDYYDYSGTKFNDYETGRQSPNFQLKNDYYNDRMLKDNNNIASYRPPMTKPNYEYGEQYDLNLARQYTSSPKEYSTFTTNTGPYSSFAPQTPSAYTAGTLSNQDALPSYDQNLPKPARHALTSAISNDPIIQAVEEFSNNESRLYNERLRGIQKNNIPHHRETKSN